MFGRAPPGKSREYTEIIRDETLTLYRFYADYVKIRGIITADTKFEPDLDEADRVVLADEILTPDSSRFWPLEDYAPDKSQPPFDKQFIRDWPKTNPGSDYELPQDVIDKIITKYKEAYAMLTGKELDRSITSGVMDCKKENQLEFHHFHAGDATHHAKSYRLRPSLTSDSTPLGSFL